MELRLKPSNEEPKVLKYESHCHWSLNIKTDRAPNQ